MRNTLSFATAARAAVTDLGRFTLTDYGVPTNGAADQYAARAANILVGNADNAALIEITATDLVFTTEAPLMLAVTGAPATVTVDGVQHPQWAPIVVAATATVTITGISRGLYTYVAVRGTIIAERFGGSYAPDPLLEVGTRITSGTILVVDTDLAGIEHPYIPLFWFAPQIPAYGNAWTLDIIKGPEFAQFGADIQRLTTETYVVGEQSNQVGTRLTGPRPTRQTDAEILSRGVPLGAIEVPPSGDLIVLQRGRPVTAGYPVIAVVTRSSRDALGQLRPGDFVRMRPTTIEAGKARYAAQRRSLDQLRTRVQTAFEASGIRSKPTAEQGFSAPWSRRPLTA